MNDGCSTTLGDNCVMRFTAGGRSRREDRRQANSGYQNQQSDKISLREFHQSWHVLSLSKEFRGRKGAAGASVLALHGSYFIRPSVRKVFSTSGEQSAVALVTNLREVANSRCWVSNELEAIFWRWCERRLRLWCHHRYGYGGGVLDEIAAEGRPVAERPLLRYALPLNTERLEESAYQSQGVKRV